MWLHAVATDTSTLFYKCHLLIAYLVGPQFNELHINTIVNINRFAWAGSEAGALRFCGKVFGAFGGMLPACKLKHVQEHLGPRDPRQAGRLQDNQ